MSSTFSWLEPALTPALDTGIAKSGTNLVHSHPHNILSHALCKSKKIFSSDAYHQTNLDHKSFSISEDIVEMIVA